MVFNGKRFAALGVDGSDVLLYFLESALDFPSCGIKLDHLFCCKREVGGDQRESESFVIYENDFDLTSECLGYAEQLGELDFAVFAVNMDYGRSCGLAQLSGKNLDRCELFAELRAAAAFAGNNIREIVENGGDAQAGQYVNAESDFVANFHEQRFCSEPAVADDQYRTFEPLNEPDYQFRSDTGFSLEPFGMRQLGAGFHGFRKRHVELLRERQAGPAAMTEEQQPGENPAVAENPLRGVLFGRMIKVAGAPGDFLAGFAVSGVVKPDQQTAVHRGIAHNSGEESPQGIPRQLAGIEKVVELLEGGVTREQQREFPENITDPSGTAASTKSDNDSFEDDLAIGGNYRCRPIEKLVEFHVRLLSRLNEHDKNIAQAPCGREAISTYNTSSCNDEFDIAKWLLTA